MNEIRGFFQTVGQQFESNWQPSIDIYRHRDGWLVKCDVAGVRPEDLEICGRGRRLTIAGVRRDWSIMEGARAYSMEISYDRFRRTIDLPCALDDAELAVEYRDGMLLISIVLPSTER